MKRKKKAVSLTEKTREVLKAYEWRYQDLALAVGIKDVAAWRLTRGDVQNPRYPTGERINAIYNARSKRNRPRSPDKWLDEWE